MNRRESERRCARISMLLAVAVLGIVNPLRLSAQQSWGYNFYGELCATNNNGNTSANPGPITMTGLSGVASVAAGNFHSLSLKSDGTVWACGYNGRGALGVPTNSGLGTANPAPLQVTAVSNIKAVSAGNHSLALQTDGTVWAWGSNRYGQIGTTTNNGTNNANPTPAPVNGIGSVAAIAAGLEHSLALKTDGTVWGWGYNFYGQLGNDINSHTATANPTPAKVSGLPVIVAIAAGEYHSLALAADGTVWGWGWNRSGQLGNSTNNQTDSANSVPVPVSGLSGVTAIAAGFSHSLALTSDTNVWAWGLNSSGQLGNTTNDTNSNPNPNPAKIASFTGVKAIAAGDAHSLAIKTDGTVWTWGFNLYGELGPGGQSGANPTPLVVPGVTGAAAIAGGMGDSFALPPAPVPVTIASSITGSTLSVTGAGCQPGSYASPQTLQWLPGSACTVEFTSPQSGTPGTQYVLTNWADGSISNPRTIATPAAATTYTAQFQTQYLLTVVSSPVAGGSATGGGYYNAAAVAPVVATANSGYSFANWTGPVASAGSASTTVQMTGPASVTANFAAAPTAVTIASSVPGLSFLVSGTGCQPGTYSSPQTLSWTSGSSCFVSFTSPQAGPAGTQYVFTTWEDGASTNSRTINTPASATTYTADFQTQYLLTAAASPAGAGSVTGGGYYGAGVSAPVTASANNGFAFVNWTGAVVAPASAGTSVVMSGPMTVTANFNVMTTIASAPAGLSFSVTGAGCQAGSYSTPQSLSWTPGASCSVSFTAQQAGTPGTQYMFLAWEDGPSANPRTIAAPASGTTYTADFQTQYQLTVAANPAGAGTVTGSGYYNAGSSAAVTASANSGFAFVNWTGAVTSAGSASTTTAAMNGPVTVTANFSVLTTIVSSPLGLSFSVNGAGCQEGNYATPQVLSGLLGSSCVVSFSAAQAGGTGTQYVFSGWADGSASNPRTFVVSGSAATYTANFQRQFLLTTSLGIGGSQAGSISAGGYYNEGVTTSVSATANLGYQFTGFSGDLTGIAAIQSVTMNGPRSVAANFGLITSVTVAAVAGKYSDPVSLSAAVSPAGIAVSGTVQFAVGGVPAGSVPVSGSGTYTLPYVITQKQGIYAVTAVFSSSTVGILGSSAGNNLTVSLEDAVVTPSSANPAAVLVSGGGTASITLTATIQEAADGSYGDIAKASPVTFTLNPAVAASPISCSPAAATVNNATTPPTLTAACTFTNVPVNVYDVAISIGGDYYAGAGKTAVAVYDPSLGFVNSNAGMSHNGASGSEKVDAKYRNDGSLQGSFTYNEQTSNGQVSVAAANLQSLSIVGNTAVLVAPATVNGAAGYMVRAFFVSNAGPGVNDQFGMQVTDANGNVLPNLTFGLTTLTSGNIQVH